LLEYSYIILGALFLLGAFDDLFMDTVHWVKRLRPLKITPEQWKILRRFKEKRLAIMIPAWQESSVLEAMVKTNLRRIRYQNYKWFIGVYPNDPDTLRIAFDLQSKYPEKVEVVVTDRGGPTSKAHCLNNIYRKIEDCGYLPDFLAIHDAEDVIHPDAFTAVSVSGNNQDFIQLPIFSLPVPVTEWVSGTYLDEFAEIHLREIPVRKVLGMPIPSAGVGTFFSRTILQKIKERFGYVFDEGNLTEDYEISLRIARLGGRQEFLLIRDEKGEVVATREYFPHEFKRSVRQKTRWTTGIALQTTARWKAFGTLSKGGFSLKNLPLWYALFRDRKSLWSNPALALAWGLLPLGLMNPNSLGNSSLHLRVNLALFMVRLIQRARFCTKLYGWKHVLMSFPRVLLSNLINTLAGFKALFQYFSAPRNQLRREIVWDKTDHRFPDLGAA
jgi:adsorption protein B